MEENLHEFSILKHPSGKKVKVDKKLAKLIRAIWKYGLDTALCCEENVNDRAWIMMPAVDFDILMLWLSGHHRMTWQGTGEGEDNNVWYLAATWEDGNAWHGKGLFIHWRFDIKDVPDILKHLRKAMKNDKAI